MAYTRVWDELFPADTQAANQLGLDIRQFKQDARERMKSFGAGLLSARETPEAVFGDANKGVTYYATDEGVLYLWNGSAWNAIAGATDRLLSDLTTVTITNPAVETNGNVIVIPAGFLIVGSVIEIDSRIRKTAGDSTFPPRLYFGTTIIGSPPLLPTASPQSVWMSGTVVVTATAAQRNQTLAMGTAFPSGQANVNNQDPTEAISGAITVKTTSVGVGAGTGTYVHDMLVVRIRK